MADFTDRLRAYHIAKADLDRHQFGENPEGHEAELEFDKVTDRLSNIHTDALDGLLLSKAETRLQLLRKLEIIVAEEVHDNWHLSAPIMALALDDARRLIGGA